MSNVASFLTLSSLALVACRAAPTETSPLAGADAPQAAPEVREADPMLDSGFTLIPREGHDFGLQLRVPVSVGWTTFDLDEFLSLDQLTTLAVVPTVEFVIPLSERWTLLPFLGVGAARQFGDDNLVGGSEWLGLATGGVRATRWQHFAERHWFGFMGQVRYDAVTGRDGLLGDWGSVDAALELRRDFGAPRAGPRFQGGLYLYRIRFWDPVELDISGVSPSLVEDTTELGISLGSTSPYRILGIRLPHVFLGALIGDGLTGARIRFGRL